MTIGYGETTGDVPTVTNLRLLKNGLVTVKKASNGEVTALTSGTSVAIDLSLANNFSLTIGHAATLANPTNATAGQSGAIVITQDGVGSRTLVYAGNWNFTGGTAPDLTATLTTGKDVLVYYVESSTIIHAAMINDMQ